MPRTALTFDVYVPAWLAHPEVEDATPQPDGSTRVQLRDGPAFRVAKLRTADGEMMFVSREESRA